MAICIRDLIKAALRMRPSRIIVGEDRDSAAIDLLDAYNTGHDGSLSTGHGNSIRDMLSRLEMMVLMGTQLPLLAIRQQIASAVDILTAGRFSEAGCGFRKRTERILQIYIFTGAADIMENHLVHPH